jgi:hypothetical protein
MTISDPPAMQGPSTPSARPGRRLVPRLADDARDLARVMVLAVPLGAVTAGVVARLAMLLLARTNPTASGITSDDGFTINQFTLSGSLNLALVGAVFGALSGVLYVALAPLKIGPSWFGRLSLCVGAGVVVGSIIVHPDGVDFVFLDNPVMLAVTLFVLVPTLHVLALDVLVERARARGALVGRPATVLGLLLSLAMAPLVVALGTLRATWLLLCARMPGARWLRSPWWAWAARAGLAVVFVGAVLDIGGDVAELA